MSIRVLPIFGKNTPKDNRIIIDTTSNNHPVYSGLSPFVLPAPPARRFENLWQFSKVYKCHIMAIDGYPDASWYKWRDAGYASYRAIRYPMGKGAVPEYSLWDGEKLDYIQARKIIYAPEYAKNVMKTDSYKILMEQYGECSWQNKEVILLDYDAYDHQALGMTLRDVINEPSRKMGHAFVLMMLLTGEFEKCVA